jgi:hypothetical protein
VSFQHPFPKDVTDGRRTNSINPVIAGKTIYLAPRLRNTVFEDNFRIYK